LEKYVGRYEVPEGVGIPYPFFGVMLDRDTLVLQVKTDKAWYPLTAQSETSFYHLSVNNDFEVTFVLEASGEISHLVYEERGQTYNLNRMPQAEAQSAGGTAAESPAAPQTRLGETGGNPGVGPRIAPALALVGLGALMARSGARRRGRKARS
jgi:hypothetical protein